VTYFAHGATLALAWFLAINVAASVIVAAIARRAPRSSGFLLGLRLAPAASSIVFVAAVFLPSYLKFEPRQFAEGFDVSLTALALVAAVLVAAGAARGIRAWRNAASRTRSWTRAARALTLDGIRVPTFLIDAPQPLMALAGIVRPRLIVTSGLLDALTPEEIAASAAHEAAHHRAWDNLKRLAIRSAPDILHGTRTARAIERAWAAAAERSADAASADPRSAAARLALASALVKVARLMPAAVPAAEPISTLVGGGDIASRVERLIDDGQRPIDAPTARSPWLLAGAASAAAILIAGYLPLLAIVHQATEILVHRLP